MMSDPLNIEALRKVAEKALGCADIKVTYDSVGRQYTHIANSSEVAASIIRLVCALLLSELEAVKGENERLRSFVSGGLRADFVEQGERVAAALPWKARAQAAEQALSVLKGEVEKAITLIVKLQEQRARHVLERALSTLYDKLSSIEVRPELPSDGGSSNRSMGLNAVPSTAEGRCIDTSFSADRWTCDGEWHRGWSGHDPYAERCPKAVR